MRQIKLERTLKAPRSAVWSTLADFPNIAEWNSGVETSYKLGDAVEGVGARRHCDLKPMGTLDETITAWKPEEQLVISIDKATRLPIKRGMVTFALADADDPSATEMSFTYDYETRLSFLEPLVGGMIDKQLLTGFGGFLDDLEAAAAESTAA